MIERAVINTGPLIALSMQIYGLPVKGTAGLLAEASRRGLIGELRPLLEQLKSAGYFLADSVVEAACQAAKDAQQLTG